MARKRKEKMRTNGKVTKSRCEMMITAQTSPPKADKDIIPRINASNK